MKNIYDVTITRKNINTNEVKTSEYQVIGEDITHAVFKAGQQFHNDQWDVEHLFVSGASVLNNSFYEWSAK